MRRTPHPRGGDFSHPLNISDILSVCHDRQDLLPGIFARLRERHRYGDLPPWSYIRLRNSNLKFYIEGRFVGRYDRRRQLRRIVFLFRNTEEEITRIIERWTGIPVTRMLASEREKLLHMEDELHRRVIGQEQAIAAISDAVRRSRAGLNDPRKPIGSFIFLGTTGVGKTELAKALAEFLFNDDNMLTRIDMSEYQERHSVSRLVGAPPGYVGYDEGGQLTEAVRRKPYSVVLLDEIEKAHPDVFNILLQVLDDGRLTDNKGRTVDFRNTIIIMTSNMGAQVIQENFAPAFDGNKISPEVVEKTRLEVIEQLKMQLKPEFLNRIDEIVMFEPLTHEDIGRIVDIQMNIVRKLLKENNIELDYTKKAKEWIARIGYDPLYGARPVKRTIQRYVVNDLSKRILAGDVNREHPIVIDADADGLTFKN